MSTINIAHSQTLSTSSNRLDYDKCGFEFKRNLFLTNNSNYQEALQQEKDIKKYTNNGQPKSNNIYRIPVVVHVLHLGEAVGTGTNISDAQIQSSIDHLNLFYRGQTANSPVDFKIEFSLAKQDPNCNSTTGINRVDASTVSGYSSGGVDYYGDGGQADENTLKNLSRWSETEYFNIWIISEIEDNNGGGGIQGYANFYAGNAYEGSMMMYNVFGYDPNTQQPYNLKGSRDNSTVAHEFGHYLHLHHTFKGDGDTNNDNIGDACPLDQTVGVDSDGCSDTEPHKRYTSQCKSGQINDCTGAVFSDNSAKNIMSYSSCQDRLTNDQKTRARAMLSTSAINLIYSLGDEEPVSTTGTLSTAICIPQSSSTAISGGYGGITNFTLVNEFSSSSSTTQGDGGYVDFTSECLKTISLFEDSTYSFELTTWYNGHDYKGYIDFNNDGDFSDRNEEVFSGSNPPNIHATNGTYNSTGNGTLNIPITDGVNVLANTPMRLRIISELTSVTGTITDACYTPFYAQAEDYLLVINQAAGPCSATYSTDTHTACNSYTWIDGNTYNSSVIPTLNTNHNVQTQGMTFSPSSININVGDTVTFYNTGGFHNVNGSLATFPNNPEGFNSGNPSNSNWTFTHVFTLPGTYNYQCDPHAPSMAGVINVSSTNNITHTINNSQGCDSVITLDLTINSSPSINIGNDTTICDNASITLDAGSGYSSYLWSTGSTVQTINVNSSGTYSVTVTDNNNCSGSDNIAINTISCNNSTPKTYVPDDNFEAYLETHNSNGQTVSIGDPTSMGDGIANNDSVLTANISGVNNLDVEFQNISDLTGIEDFVSLYSLNCSNNQLNFIDVTQNTQLTILRVYGNQLTSLNVSQNTDLQKLYCDGNQISSLDISSNLLLEELDCYRNQLSSLDVSQNVSLVRLLCHTNPIFSLDVTNNTLLTMLSCRGNQLSYLDVSQNTNLESFSCDDNQLSSLNLNNNTALTDLQCDDNQFTSLDFTQNTLLTFLDCSGNQLNSLDFNQNNELNELDCSSNQLTCLRIRNLTNPALILNASSNSSLNCIEVDDPNYATLNWSTNNGQWTFSTNCNYTSGCFPSSSIGPKTYVPDDNFEAYLEANGMGDGIANNDSVLTANINAISYLDVNNQNISDLSGIQSFTVLTSLFCKNNLLTSLDITQNTSLVNLNCRYNQISSLDVSQNTNLVSLICNDNNLTSIDISLNTLLQQFGCEDNQLTSLNLSNNTSLVYFICGDNQIASLDISNNTSLTYLGCHANQLTSLDISNNNSLSVLSFGDNQLISIDVSNLTSLTELRCYGNQLTCLNLKNGNNTNITDFNSTDNPNLNCIEVDNPNWSNSNWSSGNGNIDSGVSFSINCSYTAGCF